jgi:riboflavin synthase
VPSEWSSYIAAKGSVALDGVSLTVNEVEGDCFGVNIIPHTQKMTTFGDLKIGDKLNMEVDILARYIARLSQGERA